ncbi:DUF72 domain-containing protein [Pararhizobium sp. PWRC1-1]|uniref:DUF72 domain-containing protein n=1 Tax=Pararhizobium sp. PWRC1-1 TaxID=2804566 RepID=UPI003CECEE7B
MVDPSPEAVAERRARRAERRQKQRDANIGRADKMNLVRLAARHGEVGSDGLRALSGRTHIGCSGWYYWHWKGHFYPADTPSNQMFDIYQSTFKTVELNAPFYSWPTIAAVKTWVRQAAPDFVYTVKVCELITHVKRFEDTETLVEDFGYIADLLGQQMGCFLFQLPPSVRYSAEMLHRILSQLDPSHRNVVEFRHRSWWSEEVFNAFRAAGAIFCSCSGPRLPDELVRTADDIYVRFHGTTQWYRHDYSDEELLVWADRIRASGAKTTWVYFNNDRDGYSIKNAKRLAHLLEG